MLTFLIGLTKPLLIYGIYFGCIVLLLVTIFKRVEWGLYMFIFLIPIPNFWHKFIEFPLGKDLMDLFFAAVLLGMFIQKKNEVFKSNNSILICLFIVLSYASVWNACLGFGLPYPLTRSCPLLADWKNYVEMICLYYLALNTITTEKQIKIATAIAAMSTLLISVRNFRNFTAGSSFDYRSRCSGPFESVGLGANHFGAYIVSYCAVFLGMFFFQNEVWLRYLFLSTVLFGLHPLFFAYSRGAYAAALGVMSFYGMRKKILLIIAAVVLISWQTVLPESVVDRIAMTEDESGQIEASAAHRLVLWDLARSMFDESPIFGKGYGGFGLSVARGELTDTHSFYMKTLAEQGIIGITFFLAILARALLSGWRLYKVAGTPLLKGLGFGFMGCVVSFAITNLFGDRWSYFALGGYFWVLWGLTDRAIHISQSQKELRSVG